MWPNPQQRYELIQLASKGFKGGITADGSFTFQGWMSATRAYNGGGNKNYVYYVYDQMFLKAEPR